MSTKRLHARRADDGGWLCWLAARASDFWEFIDRRDIDKHALSWAVLYGTIQVVNWAMTFAEKNPAKSGIEVAAIIAAVIAPWSVFQAAVVKWYFDARSQ